MMRLSPKLVYSILAVIALALGLYLGWLESAHDSGTSEYLVKAQGWRLVSGLSSKFLIAVATSILITVFISSWINSSLLKAKQEELEVLQSQIRQDEFKAIFLRLMPDEVFEAFKQEVIENNLVARNFKIEYEFTKGLKPDCLNMLHRVRYELHNVGSHIMRDSITVRVMATPMSHVVLREATTQESGNIISHYEAKAPEARKGIDVVPPKDGSSTLTEIVIPILVNPGKHLEMSWVFEGEYRGPVVDAYYAKYPITGGEILFRYPEDYHFQLSPSLTSKLKRLDNEAGRKGFRLLGAILPKQGFNFHLWPQKMKTDQQELQGGAASGEGGHALTQ